MAEKVTGKSKSRMDFLLSPFAVVGGVASGILIGLRYKTAAAHLAPFGDIYLSLLQMCILPIVITAIISSLGQLLTSGKAGGYIRRMFVLFVIGLVMAGVVGVVVGLAAKPGANLAKDAQVTLGRKISEVEMYSGPAEPSSEGLTGFIRRMVPSNIFSAMSQDEGLAILFFSIFIGVSLGLLRSPGSNITLSVVDACYNAFLKIIGWLMYGLPFGLLCLVADQISQMGRDIIFALLKLVIFVHVSAFILIIIYSIVIWRSSGKSFFQSFISLKETLLVSLGTSSSLAAIPSALRGLQDELKVDRDTTNLVIPLGINLNRHGSVMHFAIAAMFIAQLYGHTLGVKELAILLLGSILGGIAVPGIPGIGGLNMIALALEPIGLPVRVAVILLSAIDPVLDPILTVVNVHANCATAALVAKRDKVH